MCSIARTSKSRTTPSERDRRRFRVLADRPPRAIRASFNSAYDSVFERSKESSNHVDKENGNHRVHRLVDSHHWLHATTTIKAGHTDHQHAARFKCPETCARLRRQHGCG